MNEQKYVSSGVAVRKHKRYHTDEKCQYLRGTVRHVSDRFVKFHGAELCKSCAGKTERGQGSYEIFEAAMEAGK